MENSFTTRHIRSLLFLVGATLLLWGGLAGTAIAADFITPRYQRTPLLDGVITYCDSYPATSTDWATTLSVHQWDSTLHGGATLVDVSTVLTVSGEITWTVHSNEAGTARFRTQGFIEGQAELPDGSVVLADAYGPAANENLAGGATKTYGPYDVTETASQSVTPPLTDWIGSSYVSVPVTATALMQSTVPGNTDLYVTSTAEAIFCVKYTYTGTTAEELSSFSGKAKAKQINLKWTSANEFNTSGFNVWRKFGKAGWKQVNADFINAQTPGQQNSHQYSYTDTVKKLGKTYRYKLEVVRTDGSSSWSDVVRVKTSK